MSCFSIQEHAKLIDVLQSIKELLDQFYELTCQQTDIIETDEIEDLEQNLEKRQRIIDEVDVLHRELGSLTSPHALTELWLPADEPKRDEIIRIQDSIQDKLRETQIQNCENEEKTRQRMEYYSQAGRKAVQRRKSICLYNRHVESSSPVYFDKRN